MRTHYWETRQSMTPQKSLQFLKEGNKRFINNLRLNHNHLEVINETSEKQFPFATILSCSDSRVPVELVFDQGLGDIFSIRLAGNVASKYAIGSMEYACEALGSKLFVVLGHSGCGAVKGATDNFEMDNLTALLNEIKPAVDAEKETTANRTSSNKEFVSNVIRLNVEHQLETILNNSPIIRKKVESGEIGLIGAIYNLETGEVNFFDDLTKSTVKHEKAEVYQG